jgi:predicted ArsR family transcriptional regulator
MKLSQTKQNILLAIKNGGDVPVKSLVDQLTITKQAMHRHLNELLEKVLIMKKGRPPRFFYSIVPQVTTSSVGVAEESSGTQKLVSGLDKQIAELIENNDQLITPSGSRLIGMGDSRSGART